MRLDKYLKLTRLIKRRGVAKVLIMENSILVNDLKVKPSYEVKLNDVITLKLGKRIVTIKVINIEDNVTKQKANDLYSIIKDVITTK